jgi:hypothetical protein
MINDTLLHNIQAYESYIEPHQLTNVDINDMEALAEVEKGPAYLAYREVMTKLSQGYEGFTSVKDFDHNLAFFRAFEVPYEAISIEYIEELARCIDYREGDSLSQKLTDAEKNVLADKGIDVPGDDLIALCSSCSCYFDTGLELAEVIRILDTDKYCFGSDRCTP